MRTKTVLRTAIISSLLILSCLIPAGSNPAAASELAAGKIPMETAYLWSPGKLAVDANLALYVVDSYKARVQMFDSKGTYQGTIPIALPSAIAAGRDGSLYIGSHQDYSVAIYKNGQRTGYLGEGSNEFTSIRDIAVDPATGDVYVVDAGKNSVRIFFESGRPKGSIAGFNIPMGVAIAGDEVYVLDAPVVRSSGGRGTGTGSRISVFSKNWEFIRSIEEQGREGDQMVRPAGITADRLGNIFIADASKKAVLVYNQLGQYTGQFVSSAGDLNTAVALAISPDGRVYISSSETHRVIELGLAGTIHSETKVSIAFKSKTGTMLAPDALGY